MDETVKVFRRLVLRYALGGTGAVALPALFFGVAGAQGVVLGGLTAVLMFWLSSRGAENALRRVHENLVEMSGVNRVRLAAIGWVSVRMLVYGVALYRGYTLDPAGLRGFWGVAAGLLMVRVAVTILGVTGLDLKKAS